MDAQAEKMLESGISLVGVNAPESMGGESGDYRLLSSGGERKVSGNKEEVAAAIWEEML